VDGSTNPALQVSRATKFCMVSANICGFPPYRPLNHLSVAWNFDVAFRFLENVYTPGIVKGTIFITGWGSRIFTVLNVLRQCPLVLLVTVRLQQGTALGSEEGGEGKWTV